MAVTLFIHPLKTTNISPLGAVETEDVLNMCVHNFTCKIINVIFGMCLYYCFNAYRICCIIFISLPMLIICVFFLFTFVMFARGLLIVSIILRASFLLYAFLLAPHFQW